MSGCGMCMMTGTTLVAGKPRPCPYCRTDEAEASLNDTDQDDLLEKE